MISTAFSFQPHYCYDNNTNSSFVVKNNDYIENDKNNNYNYKNGDNNDQISQPPHLLLLLLHLPFSLTDECLPWI